MPWNRSDPQRTPARHATRRALWIGAPGLLAAALLMPLDATEPPGPAGAPEALTDAQFWDFFTRHSEPGGSFVSENFVSNEVSFQEVIPALQEGLAPGSAYLGVGPEQNFTYIAALRPRVAVIIDIRRQNAMQHLMYKALFELSPTRADFVSRLFSRPFHMDGDPGVAALFDAAASAAPSDSAFEANTAAIAGHLTRTHRFPLAAEDLAAIRYVHSVFFEAGPEINYGYRSGVTSRYSSYATLGMLQEATSADGRRRGFLASDSAYRTVRELQQRNLVIPVVGDFAGPWAIRRVGDWLRSRGLTVGAFYLSNVEQYLFREGGAAERFYANVASLPVDGASRFIRSVPRSGAALVTVGGVAVGGAPGRISFRVSVHDSLGVRAFRLVQDSGSLPLVRTKAESAALALPPAVAARDSLSWRIIPGVVRPLGRIAGTLASGLASIVETLEAEAAGRLNTYQSVVAMTQVGGWARRP